MKAIALVISVAMTSAAVAAPDPAAPADPDPAAPPRDASPEQRFAPPSLAPLVAPPRSEETAEPPIDGGRLVGETLVGGGVGFVGLVLGAVAGVGIECSGGCPGEFGGLGGAIIGGAIGGVFGIGTGVYLIGNAGDQTGSFGATIGGAFLGATLGGLAAAGFGSAKLDTAAGITAVAGPFVGALIGFNVTRRWDRPSQSPALGSLVRFDHGALRAGIPLVTPATANGGSLLSIASGTF